MVWKLLFCRLLYSQRWLLLAQVTVSIYISSPHLPTPLLCPCPSLSPLLPHPLPLQYCRQTFFEDDIIDQHKQDEERECWQEEDSSNGLANGLVKKQESSDEKLQVSSLSRIHPSAKNPPKKLPLAQAGRKGCSPDIPRKSSSASMTPSTPPASFKFGCEWVLVT